jgi:hypothetical protein
MANIAALKLVNAKRPHSLPAVQMRRNKMSKRIWEQIQLAKSQQGGEKFVITRLRSYADAETGERKQIEAPKRIKPWWFVQESGKLAVTVRYGARLVEFAKGKCAVEIASASDLIKTLEVIKAAVEAGELDAQLEQAAATTRAAFGK